ncbi:hypothetical protein [Clostridium sp.]|uniref:hypothetical protein n=1 Tax=Clostridium sp. TaxID=1506 RepID=UPI003F2BAD34
MRGFLKNKDFIPESFIRNKSDERRNGNKRGILLMFIINLFLIPLSISKIKTIIEPVDSSIKINENLVLIEDKRESLINWLNLIDNKILYMKIKNNLGEINFPTLEDASNFEEKENLNIRSLEKNDKGNYKINVQ